MGCVLSEPISDTTTSTFPSTSSLYAVKDRNTATSNIKQQPTHKQSLRTSKTIKTRSSTVELGPDPDPTPGSTAPPTVSIPIPIPTSAASTRHPSLAPLQFGSGSTSPSASSPTPSKHERAYEYTGEQQTHEVINHEYPRIDLTLIPCDALSPPPQSQTDRVPVPATNPTPSPTLGSASVDNTPRCTPLSISISPSPSLDMLQIETRRAPQLVLSPSSSSSREAPSLSRPLSITTSHDAPTLKLPHINTSSSTTPATAPAASLSASSSSSSIGAIPSISTSASSASPFSPSSLSISTNHSPRQPLHSISSSRPSLSRPGSADRSARHHHLPPPTPSHFTPHSSVPDTPSFCSPRNAHAKSFFGASASKPPGMSRPGSASSRATISQRAVPEAESSSSEEEADEESSDDEEEEEEESEEESMNAPPPVRSKLSLSITADTSITTTSEDDDNDPPVFKSVAHLRIDPAAEPCATVIKPPLRRMCRARHVVWDASPEANHAAYQPPSEILPFLYLGCYDNVYDTPVKSDAKQKEMQALGLSHVLTVATECATPYSQFEYLKISIQDDVRSHIHPHFIEAFDFIDQARDKGGKCIVHCWAGVSRSATIVIGYLIARMGMRFDLAHAHVRERRPIVHPNISFREALLNLDACVHEPERYAQQQKEFVAMIGDTDNAIVHMDRNIVCGDKKLWGTSIPALISKR